jgi:arginine decarboxylase
MKRTPFPPYDVLLGNASEDLVTKQLIKGEQQGITFGCRIPCDYFETSGKGESDIAVHAGSYHLALKDAGIERYNIMTYSSILPGIARLIEQPADIMHGSVVESIMSICHVQRGERGTAGIIYGWLYDRKTQERYGGLVCENFGDYTAEALREILESSINELYVNGFDVQYELRDIKYMSRTVTPAKKHGTALVALCFTSYFLPASGVITK